MPVPQQENSEQNDSSLGKVLHSGAATAISTLLPAAITFMLNRRVNTAGMTAAQKNVAKRIREQGLARTETPTDSKILQAVRRNPLLRYMQYGTDKVYRNPWAGSYVPRKYKDVGVVMDPGIEIPRNQMRRGPTQYVGNDSSKPVLIGAGEKLKEVKRKGTNEARSIADSKFQEAQLFNRYAPGSLPETMSLGDVPLGRALTPAQKIVAMRDRLAKQYDGKFIIKRDNDSQSANAVLSDSTPMLDIYDKYSRIKRKQPLNDSGLTIEKLEHALKTKDQSTYQSMLNDAGDYQKYRVIKDMLKAPANAVGQRRAEIKPLGTFDNAARKMRGSGTNTEELRIHTMGDQVLPASSSRNGPISAFSQMMGYKPQYLSDAENFVQSTIKKLPKRQTNNRMFAMDVARTQDGGFKIIESNPNGHSGYLHQTTPAGSIGQAINSHRLVSSLQGRGTVALSGARALGAGGLGYGALTAARQVVPEPQEDKPIDPITPIATT